MIPNHVLKLPIVLDPILSLPTTSLSGQATPMSAYSQLIEYFLWQKIFGVPHKKPVGKIKYLLKNIWSYSGDS